MSFTKTGLPNGGQTAHYEIRYDNSLSQADGLDRAIGLMAKCEQDFALMKQWFGGRDLTVASPIPVHIENATDVAANTVIPSGIQILFGADALITLQPQSGMSVDVLRYLLVSEVTELFMLSQDRGWFQGHTFFQGGDEGSKGEGLSQFLAVQFQLANGLGRIPPRGYGITFKWLNSARQDFVNVNPDDHTFDSVNGCTTLFLYYLHDQLGFGTDKIVAAGAANLAGVHQHLTGQADGWTPFINIVNSHYPEGPSYHPSGDSIFPVAELSGFWAPNQVTTGYRQPVQVFIDRPAKAEVHIRLSSDNPALVKVDPLVTVSAGYASTSFKVSAAAIPIPFTPKSVKVHATYAGQTRTISVEVVPPKVASITLSPDTVVCGHNSIGTVILDRPSLLGDVVVDLVCGAPGFATVPAQVTILQNQPSAQFVITTKNILIPFVPAHAVIVASYAGSSASATLTVNPKVIAGIIDSLTLFPAAVTGGNSSTGIVTLVAAVPTPTLVGLAAQEFGPGPGGGGSSFVASVPSSITIAAGQTTGIFSISTTQLSAPINLRMAMIIAAAVNVKYATLKVTS